MLLTEDRRFATLPTMPEDSCTQVHFHSSEAMPELPDGSVDFVITSPPYWHLKNYGGDGEIGPSSYDEYLQRLNRVWQECYRVAKPNGVLVINVNARRHDGRYIPIPYDIVARMTGWRLWDTVVWYVPNALPQPNSYRERLLDNKYETLLIFTRDGRTDYTFHKPRVPQKYLTADPRAHKKNAAGRCLGNVLRIPAYRPPTIRSRNYHVAAFPEELVAFFLACYTDPGDLVLDPFCGSGTTMKVAQAMERRGVSYEVNPAFAELIQARIDEPWSVPDWREIDLLHSTTNETGRKTPRRPVARRTPTP